MKRMLTWSLVLGIVFIVLWPEIGWRFESPAFQPGQKVVIEKKGFYSPVCTYDESREVCVNPFNSRPPIIGLTAVVTKDKDGDSRDHDAYRACDIKDPYWCGWFHKDAIRAIDNPADAIQRR